MIDGVSPTMSRCVEYGGAAYPNPYLRAGLRKQCGDGTISCFPGVSDGLADFVESNAIGKEVLPPPDVLEETREEESDMLIKSEQRTSPVPPWTFGVAAQVRGLLSHAKSHGDPFAFGHMFMLHIPPGVACEPELHRLVDGFNRMAHDVRRGASHGGARTREEIRNKFVDQMTPILEGLLREAEAIEARRTSS